MALEQQDTKANKVGQVAQGAMGFAFLTATGLLRIIGRLMRSWTGVLILVGSLLYFAPFGGTLIGLATGTAGPLDFLTSKLGGALMGPNQPADVFPSRSYGDSPQESLNEQVELYLRQSKAQAMQNPNSITLLGDARVLSAEPQADGNFKLEIEATVEIAHKAFGISLGYGRQRVQLLAVEKAGDHSVTIYSMLVLEG